MTKLAFKEWLNDQAKKASNPKEIALKKKEWIHAVETLFKEMETWIRQEDPDGIVKMSCRDVTIDEEEFGTYSAPALRFMIGVRFVEAVPIARNVLGPSSDSNIGPISGEGRVDLVGGVDRIQIYRVRDIKNSKYWVIVNQDQLTFKSLDKETFQEAIQGLFS